jgi:hypothetical protein
MTTGIDSPATLMFTLQRYGNTEPESKFNQIADNQALAFLI